MNAKCSVAETLNHSNNVSSTTQKNGKNMHVEKQPFQEIDGILAKKKFESSQCFCYGNDSLRCVLREFSKQNTRNQVKRLKVWEMLCRLTLLVLFCKNIDFKVKYAVSCLVHSILGVEVCSIQELVQLSIR